MRNFILSADAGCDLSAELCKQYDVKVLPLRYLVGGAEYSSDDGKMPAEKICERMLAGDKTSTSQANPEEAEKYLRALERFRRESEFAFSSSPASAKR